MKQRSGNKQSVKNETPVSNDWVKNETMVRNERLGEKLSNISMCNRNELRH